MMSSTVKSSRFLFFSITFSRVIYAICWYNLAATFPAMTVPLHYTVQDLGWLTAAFLLGTGLLQVPAGIYSAHKGASKAALIGLFVIAITSIVPPQPQIFSSKYRPLPDWSRCRILFCSGIGHSLPRSGAREIWLCNRNLQCCFSAWSGPQCSNLHSSRRVFWLEMAILDYWPFDVRGLWRECFCIEGMGRSGKSGGLEDQKCPGLERHP